MSQILQPSGLGTTTFTSVRDEALTLPSRPPKYYGDNFAAKRMIDRLSFGFTRFELDLLRTKGTEGYLRYHLNPQLIDDAELDAFLAANYPTLAMTPQQLAASQSGDVVNQLIRARLMRAIYSKRQLFERVVECWTDHFNIYIRDDPGSFLKTADDRDVIRANAMGTFPNLLRASAHSPAMLTYLNNDTNTRTGPNENYARELMELHSLSVTGPYTQTDVQQVAKCLTGWTYISTAGATQWQFRFNSGVHDTSNKTVLGNVIPFQSGNSGQQEGETVLNILADHPATRSFIATKLLRHFYSHTPPQNMIDSVANIYALTGGDIRSMLDYVLHQSISLTAPPKFKRPLHLLASLLRGLSARIVSPAAMQTPLTAAGQSPFDWSPPDGYPDTLQAWSGLLLARWNLGASLMNTTASRPNGDWDSPVNTGVRVDHTDVVGAATTAAAVVDALNGSVFNYTMPLTERTQLLNMLTPANNPGTTKIREALGTAVALPTFQWY